MSHFSALPVAVSTFRKFFSCLIFWGAVVRPGSYACPFVAMFNPFIFVFDLNFFLLNLNFVSKIDLNLKQIPIYTHLKLFNTTLNFL